MREPVYPYHLQVPAYVQAGASFGAAMNLVMMNMRDDEIPYIDGIRTISAICWKYLGSEGWDYQVIFRKMLPRAGSDSPFPTPEPEKELPISNKVIERICGTLV